MHNDFFSEIAKLNDFLMFSFDQIMELIQNDNLNANEQQVMLKNNN